MFNDSLTKEIVFNIEKELREYSEQIHDTRELWLFHVIKKDIMRMVLSVAQEVLENKSSQGKCFIDLVEHDQYTDLVFYKPVINRILNKYVLGFMVYSIHAPTYEDPAEDNYSYYFKWGPRDPLLNLVEGS